MRMNPPPTPCCGGCGFSSATVERRVPFVGRSKCPSYHEYLCISISQSIWCKRCCIITTDMTVTVSLFHLVFHCSTEFQMMHCLARRFKQVQNQLLWQLLSLQLGNHKELKIGTNLQHLFSKGWLPLLWTSLNNFWSLALSFQFLSFQIRPSAETLQKWRRRPTQSHRWKCVSLFMWGSLAKAPHQQTRWRQIGWWNATIG